MRRFCTAVVLALAVGALAACGGSAGQDTTDSATEPVPTGAESAATAPESTDTLTFTSAEVPADGPPADLLPETKYVITVKLEPGIQWSDGSPLTASDFVGQYDVLWAYQDPIWQSLTGVQAPDDQTVVFQTRDLSTNILWSLIRWNQPAAQSQYGEVFAELATLHAADAKQDSPEVAAALEKLAALELDETVGYGPYVVDPASVTAQQLIMKKNPGGYNADKIDFDEIVIYWGATQQTVPLLLSDQLDYTADVLTPSDRRALEARENIELIRTPLSTGTGLWFNESIELFSKKEFRQAVAYVLDRERNAQIALGDAARPIEYMVGFSDKLVPGWLSDETVDALQGYEQDTAKATELLESIGLRREGDGWVDSSGKPVSFEITAPADFPDFLASAKDVSEQLNDFGFETKVRGVPGAERPDVIKQAQYEAILDFSLVSTPSHPQTSLNWNMAAGFFGTNNPEATGDESKGLNWSWNQTAPDGTEVYIPDLLAQAVSGVDLEPQREAIATLAQIFNDQLPVIPIFERYTTDPIAHGPRVTGWLPATDPIYLNNQGSDNYTSMQLLYGVLSPAESGDGTFHGSAAYLQPPSYSWNLYTANALYLSLTSPAYDLSLPPLFWYSEAEKAYVPAVGQSYSVYEVG